MRIDGLDGLVRGLEELQRALEELDGNIASLSFDPHDPASIEQAIQQFFAAVDERVAQYSHNQTVVGVAEEVKEAGRNTIVEQAAAARLARGED